MVDAAYSFKAARQRACPVSNTLLLADMKGRLWTIWNHFSCSSSFVDNETCREKPLVAGKIFGDSWSLTKNKDELSLKLKSST